MTEGQLIDAVLEHLFIRGLSCLNLPLLSVYARMDRDRHGAWPDAHAFADQCTQLPGVTHRPVDQMTGTSPSRTAGASERWLAVHEAGHAIVGIRSGSTLRGIRFYGDGGPPGETGFEHFNWQSSADESRLLRNIRVDVAANLAELLLAVREPDGGRPSLFFDHHDPAQPGNYPTDIVGAWKCARHLAILQFTQSGRPLNNEEVFQARRVIVAQAEDEAELILRDNLSALTRLADYLERGPMTGTAVRAVLERE
jgi:hypothetical protein